MGEGMGCAYSRVLAVLLEGGIGSVTGQEGMFHAREGEMDKVWGMETGVD